MVSIDFIGLFLTVFLIGVRYPHYVLIAATIHEFGRIMMALFLHGKIDAILAAGAFGTTTVSDYNSSIVVILIMLSGPLANYIIGATAGFRNESMLNLINPSAVLASPFSVINFRLALLSLIVNAWQFL